MNWSEIALAILSAATAAIGGWWAFMGKKTQTAQQQQMDFYQQVISECQSLRAGNLELQKQVNNLQDEVHQLREKLEYYEENPAATAAREIMKAVFNANPNPMWIHDIPNNKWYLNNSYCTRFYVNRTNFWTPVNIFGRYESQDALQYIKNDLDVIEVGAPIEFAERVRTRIMDPNCDSFVDGRFRKTPLSVNGVPYVVGEMLEECVLQPGEGNA